MQRVGRSALVTALVPVALVLSPAPAGAAVCTTINQAVSSTGTGVPGTAISGDGHWLAVTTARDLTGDNADGNTEVFLVDLVGGGVEQLTDTTGFSGTSDVDLSADGRRVAFASTRDLVGTNADANQEIFVLDVLADTVTQVTTTTGGLGGDQPDLDAAGTRVAFASNRDLAGDNADGNTEVFLHDLGTATTTQVTDTTSGSVEPASLDATGALLAFASDQDLTGANADGSYEVFLHRTGPGTTTQMTSSTTDSFDAEMSSDGTRIAIQSRAELVTGGNPDGGYEVFVRDRPSGTFLQVTDSSGASQAPVINRDGTRVAFDSAQDLTGANPDGNHEPFVGCLRPPRCDGRNVTVDLNHGGRPTNGADVIRGRPTGDVVDGRGGNDRFCGRAGGDRFRGGGGDDRAIGEDGADRLTGGPGRDLLDGGAGGDTLDGGDGSDTCRGGSGADRAQRCEFRTSIP